MALKADVEKILNAQLDKEFDASVVYHGMAIYFEKELLPGMTAWFKRQVEEEREHAGKIIEYMLDRGADPVIPSTKAPKMSYASPLAALKGALAHERANICRQLEQLGLRLTASGEIVEAPAVNHT